MFYSFLEFGIGQKLKTVASINYFFVYIWVSDFGSAHHKNLFSVWLRVAIRKLFLHNLKITNPVLQFLEFGIGQKL